MSCGIVRPPVWQVFSEIVYRNCECISWCQNLVTGDWRRRALQMFPPDESHVRKPSHNLSKRLTFKRFHLLCPDLFISPPLSCSRTHTPQQHPHTRAHPPPSVIHPPPSTSVANTKGVEAYKRVKGFRGRAEETSNLLSSCHQLHSTFFLPHRSSLDLRLVWAAQTLLLRHTHTDTHSHTVFVSLLLLWL